MSIVTTEEITIKLNEQEAFYLHEAICAYEQGHIKSGKLPYLPELLLEIQRACNLSWSTELQEKCEQTIIDKRKRKGYKE